ncbi:MAG: regulatory protein RecX [Bacteroidales bacterium]
MNRLPLTYEKALDKAAKYCALQERSLKQVEAWLKKLNIKTADIQRITEVLINENFIDEERFARAYARGKFSINGWGRIKIRINLRMQGISDEDIKMGLQEIEEDAYLRKLETIVAKKYAALILHEDHFMAQTKTNAYAWTKGYEPELITAALQKVINQ